MKILIVDDNSPDGTGKIVDEISQNNKKVCLITGKKQGLGMAYIKGFVYAIQTLHADIVMEMDADFSHDPKDIIRLLTPIYKDSADFVIGSRYVKGGTIPVTWSFLRKLNSRLGNIFARYIAGLYQIHDCTAGFRAIRVSLLKTIRIKKMKSKGYSFQMNLLYKMVQLVPQMARFCAT